MFISIKTLIFRGTLQLLEYADPLPWIFKHFNLSYTPMCPFYSKWGEENKLFCLTEICSLPLLVFSLQHPASHWKPGTGHQSWGVRLRGALPLHRHRSHLPLHPSSQRSCDRLNCGLDTHRSTTQRPQHFLMCTLRTKCNLLSELYLYIWLLYQHNIHTWIYFAAGQWSTLIPTLIPTFYFCIVYSYSTYFFNYLFFSEMCKSNFSVTSVNTQTNEQIETLLTIVYV